ncbi:acyl-CoA dehydrogenase family protein [Luedemannella helvata]|uniref:Acyl-CoA dehydrogenase n=1 Tax=Luedemannella helvata TaxID=349315 RepID=A0ABP4VUP9_9ACTN
MAARAVDGPERDYGVVLDEQTRAFAAEVRAFLASALDADMRARTGGEAGRVERGREWQRRLNAAGLAAISWPTEYGGRSATAVQQLVFNTEIAAARAPEPVNRNAINQLGPTIIQWGSPDQRERYLPRILSGEDVWCQGFSEPDAGSDLASLRTRGVIDGDTMVITGQKIWTSKAQYANWIYLLVRTDPDAPKTRGISYVLADMASPGIEVRPIRQITGRAEFNEVFLTDVRVPLTQVVGPLHGGWRVARSTLSYERVGQSRTHRIERRLRSLVSLAARSGTPQAPLGDAAIEDRLVRFAAQVEALRQIAADATAAGIRGVSPGPEASIAKLLTSEVDQSMATFALELAGPAGTLERGSPGAADDGDVALAYLLMRAATLGAGTSEIQRNIIGEKLLGLPRDV